MQIRSNKSQANKSQSVANDQKGRKGGAGFDFADNRPEALLQRKLQEMGANSLRGKETSVLQKKNIDNRGIVQFVPHIASPVRRGNLLELLDKHQKVLAQSIGELKRSRNPLEANSAMWFEDGGDHTLFAALPTHDAATRATAAGNDGQRAYFGYPDSPVKPNLQRNLYNDPFANPAERDENITYENASTQGFNNGTTKGIAIINPADKSLEEIASTLIHEVQHSADRHNQEIARKGFMPGSWQKALSRYQSEYRAYSTQPTGGPAQEWFYREQVNNFGYTWPHRQWLIFKHIYDLYPYVKTAWDAENATEDRSARNFQKAVVNYSVVETPNATNNLNLEQAYNRLEAVLGAAPAFEDAPIVGQALTFLNKLDRPTANELLGSEIWNRVRHGIDPYVRRALLVVLNPIAGLAPPPALNDREAIEIRKYFKALQLEPGMRFSRQVIDHDSDLITSRIRATPRGRLADIILRMNEWRDLENDSKEADEFLYNQRKLIEFDKLIRSNDQYLLIAYNTTVKDKPEPEPDKEDKINLCLMHSIWGEKMISHQHNRKLEYTGYTTKAVAKLKSKLEENASSYRILHGFYGI